MSIIRIGLLQMIGCGDDLTVEKEGRIPFFVFIPGVALEFFLIQLLLDLPGIVEFDEIPLHLAIVAPEPEVIGHMHAYHTGLDSRFSLGTIRKAFEEGTAKIQATAGIHAYLGNPVFCSYGRNFNHGVASNRTSGATVSSDRVLPCLCSQIESCIVGPVGNPVEIVRIAGARIDAWLGGPPLTAS